MQIDRHQRVAAAIAAIAEGRMVILVDDEDRENEGDLVLGAERVTPQAINFMRKQAGGLICLALTEERCDKLGLRPMTPDNRSPRATAFTVSIEARSGVSTGISAADRAHTIRVAVSKEARPEDLITPGHVFPLRARRGGVLVRAGHTEGSVDLARLAGLEPAAVICEIMNDDGTMARMPDLERIAKTHDLPMLSMADLIEYRLGRDSLVERVVSAPLPIALPALPPGISFDASVFRAVVEPTEFLALALGDLSKPDPTLVRVQSMCIPGDVLGSRACDCGGQMQAALRRIVDEGRGVFLYVYPSSRMTIARQIDGHVLHRPAEEVAGPHALRDVGLGAQVLAQLGLQKIRLMSNNPTKIVGLDGFGLEVVERIALEMPPTRENLAYLRQKRDQEGHLLGSDKLTGTKR